MRLLYEPLNDLPTGFTEVEYLESTGTQWIDTGILPSEDLRTKVVQAYTGTSIAKNSSILGSNGNGNLRYWINYDNHFEVGYGNYLATNVVVQPNEVNTIDFNYIKNGSHYFSFNGTEYTSSGTPNTQYNIILFGRVVMNSSPVLATQRIYKVQFIRNDVLIGDFIPVLDWSGVPCMYDKVTGKVFYNQGTGSFTYGREIHRVEYLESTGTQYIDTGVKLTNNHSVEVDYQLTSASQNRKGIFGGLVSNGARYGALLSPSNNYLEFGYGSTNVWYQSGLPDTKRHVMKQEKNLLYFDGSLTHTFNTATFTQNFTSPLGNFNYTNYNPASAKYYSSRWWDGDTLVRHYVPAIDENGVGFMFDKVSHTVYLNAGTGAFKYPATQVEYIESTSVGGCFDLGIKYKSSMSIKLKYSRTDMGASGSVLPLSTSTTSPVLYFPALNANAKTDRFVWRRGGYTEQNYYMSFASYPTDDFEVFLDATLDKLYINGTNIKSGMIAGMNGYNSPYQSASNLYVFSIDGTYGGLGKVYYVKIYDTTQVYRDLIPAWKDGSLGFYDKQNDVFYTNTKQSGTFVAGKIQPMKKLRLMIDSKRRLPTGFKEVEYLESTGTQYIDTEYTINTSTDEVETYFQLITTDKYKWLMGEHDNGARFGIGSGDGTNLRNIAYGASTYKVNDTEVYNSQHYFNANSNGVYVNGTRVKTFEDFTSTSTIYLFNLNISGGGNGASGKIWSYKHKRNGILIRDFVPCIDPQGVPCMYDLVGKKPYYNKGTGTFTAGRQIIPVEYLESTGTQYIDTGVMGNGKFNINYGLYVKSLSTSSDIFAGTRSSSQHLNFGQAASNGQFTIGYLNQYWQELQNFAINTRYDIEISYKSGEQYAIINGTKGSSKAYTGTEQTDLTIYLFKRHHYGTDNVGGLKGRIYYFTIKQNDTLVRDFIPCKDENGVGYLLDKVSHTLYNNSGTGAFTVGDEVKDITRFLKG